MNTNAKKTIGTEILGTQEDAKLGDDLSVYDNLVINHYLKKKLYFLNSATL